MTEIAVLAVNETVRIDTRRLEQIVHELGETTAEQVIGAALEQLALALRRTLAAAVRDDPGAIAANADQLSRLAWQVGLVSLAGVAIDVGACAERRDLPALAATTRRLERIANRSLTELWDPPETA